MQPHKGRRPPEMQHIGPEEEEEALPLLSVRRLHLDHQTFLPSLFLHSGCNHVQFWNIIRCEETLLIHLFVLVMPSFHLTICHRPKSYKQHLHLLLPTRGQVQSRSLIPLSIPTSQHESSLACRLQGALDLDDLEYRSLMVFLLKPNCFSNFATTTRASTIPLCCSMLRIRAG